MKNKNKLLIAILCIGFFLRIGYGLYFFHMNGTSKYVDDFAYISVADRMLEQGLFFTDISNMHSNADVVGPGFPLILAIMFKIFGHNYYPVVILNALLSTFTMFIIYKLGDLVFNQRIALVSAIWSVFYIQQIRYIPHLLKESWVIFLFPLIVYLFIYNLNRLKIDWRIIIFSLLYSLLIHIDERYFTYFPMFIIMFLLLDINGWKQGLRKMLIFTATTLLLLVPWTIRNYKVYDRPVLLSVRTAKFTDPIWGYKDDNETIELRNYIDFMTAKRDSILKGEEISIKKSSRVLSMKKAISQGIIPHKFNPVERCWVESIELWRPVRFRGGFVGKGFRYEGPSWSLKHNLSQGLTYGILLPFLIVGCFFIVYNRCKAGYVFISIFIIHTIIHAVLDHARNRYRIPIDAFVIIVSFYGIYYIIEQVKKKYRKGREN